MLSRRAKMYPYRKMTFVTIGVIIVILLYLGSMRIQLEIANLQEANRILETAVKQLQIQRMEKRVDTRIFGGGAGGGSPVEIPVIDLSQRKDLIVIYNRVPKTGSTSFINVAYDLCKRNAFHVLHINITANMHVLSLPNQARFVLNVSHWEAIKPALYHGHMAFIDFQKFGVNQHPVWINLIRRPLDRLVSYYYFLRFGDDFRPHLVRRKHGDKMTFDECVAQKQQDCNPDNMWLQIPFFCGHAAACWEPANKWALEEAKRNLLSHYLLVGVTEEMDDFIRMLEVTLPNFFSGATKHYLNSEKSHLRRTMQKGPVSPETTEKIMESRVWQMEQELYDFALAQFHYMRRRTLEQSSPSSNLSSIERTQLFMYEKIRPK